jgi:glycosyltransferase involved in cell wall biosynthesis
MNEPLVSVIIPTKNSERAFANSKNYLIVKND